MRARDATIAGFFSKHSVDLTSLAAFLGELEPAARTRAVRSLSPSRQALLYDAAAGFRPIRLTDLVPPGTPPLQEVVHPGRLSLPMTAFFEKRLCLAEEGDELWGYNEHPFRVLTGPGYFAVREEGALELTIDYSCLPSSKPADWPDLVSDPARLGRLIFPGLVDHLRGVSAHVTVGRATKYGKVVDLWFVLNRSEPSPK
jgi:hypothetical protein